MHTGDFAYALYTCIMCASYLRVHTHYPCSRAMFMCREHGCHFGTTVFPQPVNTDSVWILKSVILSF